MENREITLAGNSEGVWDEFDDSLDIVIHCRDEEDQKKAIEMIRNARAWIPATERVPDDYRYIMLSFANGPLVALGRYEDGEFYAGDDEEPLSAIGLIVNAWMELPQPYREREDA